MKTAEEFEKATGYKPAGDDLERVNCDKVGNIGHGFCGWCEAHNKPRAHCGCMVHVLPLKGGSSQES